MPSLAAAISARSSYYQYVLLLLPDGRVMMAHALNLKQVLAILIMDAFAQCGRPLRLPVGVLYALSGYHRYILRTPLSCTTYTEVSAHKCCALKLLRLLYGLQRTSGTFHPARSIQFVQHILVDW